MWTPDHRRAANRSGLRYPSDLTDAEWAIVGAMIPPARHGGRKRSVNVRSIGERCNWTGHPNCLSSDFAVYRRHGGGPLSPQRSGAPCEAGCADANARILLGQEIDVNALSQIINSMVKIASRLGLRRRAKDVSITLNDYLGQRRSRRSRVIEEEVD